MSRAAERRSRETKETTVDARRSRSTAPATTDGRHRHPVLRPHARAARQARGLRPDASTATGDLEVDLHHTVEDVGIVLGNALREALGDKARRAPLRERARAARRSARAGRARPVGPAVPRLRRRPGRGVDRHVRSAARRGVLEGLRRRRAGHVAHAQRVGQERPPRDRGVVQGRRARVARRGAGRGRPTCRRPRARLSG